MDERKNAVYGSLAILGTALLWSLGGLLIKLIPWSAMSINAARCFIALLFKTAVRRSVKIKFTSLSVLGALCFFATTTLFVFANKLTTAANAIVLQYSSPVFIMLAAWIYLKKRPLLSDGLASAAIIAGIALCFFDNISSGGTLGNILALISGLTFGLVFFVNSLPDSSPDDANYLGFLLGTITGLP